MRKKVIALVSNNIATDQRLIKVGETLQQNGYEFHLIGTKHRGTPPLDHISFKTTRTNILFNKNFFFYAELQFRLLWELIKQPKKDCILLANDLDTLLPATIISKLYQVPLVVDFHEIFTEMPSLKNGSIQKRVWRFLESSLVPRLRNTYTVSNSYANWFNSNYGIRPKVIKNVPFQKSYQIEQDSTHKKIVLYQGAINPSRGIDKMILAMKYLNNCTLWIVGDGPLFNTYKNLAKEQNVANKIKFFGRLSPMELRTITPKASLGLSLEEDNGLSYRYALPNKIFDYIHAQVPILGSSDLPEVVEIINKYRLGDVIISHDPKHIAEKIEAMLTQEKGAYATNLSIASKDLNWENQEQELLTIFKEAVDE